MAMVESWGIFDGMRANFTLIVRISRMQLQKTQNKIKRNSISEQIIPEVRPGDNTKSREIWHTKSKNNIILFSQELKMLRCEGRHVLSGHLSKI